MGLKVALKQVDRTKRTNPHVESAVHVHLESLCHQAIQRLDELIDICLVGGKPIHRQMHIIHLL